MNRKFNPIDIQNRLDKAIGALHCCTNFNDEVNISHEIRCLKRDLEVAKRFWQQDEKSGSWFPK